MRRRPFSRIPENEGPGSSKKLLETGYRKQIFEVTNAVKC
jgi:hypothetical protein